MKASGRLLALFLALLAMFGLVTVPVLAAGQEEPAGDGGTPRYILREEEVITMDETPLAGVPMVERDCCALHFVLMAAALGVAVFYVHERKKNQRMEFEVRSEL